VLAALEVTRRFTAPGCLRQPVAEYAVQTLKYGPEMSPNARITI